MYTTIDGGLNWSNTHVPFGPNTNSVFMTDTNSIYMCGDDGSIANFGGIGGITTSIKNINEYENSGVNIYPSPASSVLNIEVGNLIDNLQIEMINMQGQLVLTKKINDKNTTINIETLSKGIYFVKIIDDKNWQVRKVIVE
jgi:hypothetical protein